MALHSITSIGGRVGASVRKIKPTRTHRPDALKKRIKAARLQKIKVAAEHRFTLDSLGDAGFPFSGDKA
jgi:hypothetical protein